jgi:hypothetical protein
MRKLATSGWVNPTDPAKRHRALCSDPNCRDEAHGRTTPPIEEGQEDAPPWLVQTDDPAPEREEAGRQSDQPKRAAQGVEEQEAASLDEFMPALRISSDQTGAETAVAKPETKSLRPPRGPDRRPRIRRWAKRLEAPAVVPEESEASGTLRDLARDILKDPEYIASLRARLKAGKATPYEHKLLAELRRLEPSSEEEDERRQQIREAVDSMTKAERRLVAHLLMKQPCDGAAVFRLRDGRRATLDQVFRLAGVDF